MPGPAPEIADDLGAQDLVLSIRQNVQVLSQMGDQELQFGYRRIPVKAYCKALTDFAARLENDPTQLTRVHEFFDFYYVYGQNAWSDIFLTSYFEPEISASRVRTLQFSEALLKRPADLLEVNFQSLDDRFRDMGPLRGRMETPSSKVPSKVVPYYSRKEISEGALSRRGLEIAYVDAVDAFTLQIQGSGTLIFGDGQRLPVRYADQNGHKYQAIGKFLLDQIPLEKITLDRIESHLRGLDMTARTTLMNLNPSYVFFQPATRTDPLKPVGSLGAEVIPGRTLAVDSRYFPKGAMVYLQFEKPDFAAGAGAEEPAWTKASRFAFDQDSGGAIRGAGRADLFWGTGKEAKKAAGVMKQRARLFYLFPKGSGI